MAIKIAFPMGEMPFLRILGAGVEVKLVIAVYLSSLAVGEGTQADGLDVTGVQRGYQY